MLHFNHFAEKKCHGLQGMTYCYAEKSLWKNRTSLSMVLERERGHCWDTIADHLNQMSKEYFLLTKDQYEIDSQSLKESEFTELVQSLQSLTRHWRILSTGHRKHNTIFLKRVKRLKKMAEKERVTAEDVRKRSMERLEETKEREKGNEKKETKKKQLLGIFQRKA